MHNDKVHNLSLHILFKLVRILVISDLSKFGHLCQNPNLDQTKTIGRSHNNICIRTYSLIV